MANLSNSIIKYDKRDAGTIDVLGGISDEIENGTPISFIVTDYTSRDFSSVLVYADSLDPAFFDWYQMTDDDKIERLSLELYGDPDYWDILLLLNKRDPLFGFPFNFDVLSNTTDSKISDYNTDVYEPELSAPSITEMTEKYLGEFQENNETNRVLKIVKPSRMYEFLQGGYEQGIF